MENIQEMNDDAKLEELTRLQAEREKRNAQEFAKAYQSLVAQFGYELVGIPEFVHTHSGTFELVVSLMVSKVQTDAR